MATPFGAWNFPSQSPGFPETGCFSSCLTEVPEFGKGGSVPSHD